MKKVKFLTFFFKKSLSLFKLTFLKKFDLFFLGANNLKEGFSKACYSGNKELVEFLIEKGANNWNDGLDNSCLSGRNIEIVKMMIEQGSFSFDFSLVCATESGNKEIIDILVENG